MSNPKPLAACPDCGHDWDRHTGSCHYIGDCSGRECGCHRKPLAAPLSQPKCKHCDRVWEMHTKNGWCLDGKDQFIAARWQAIPKSAPQCCPLCHATREECLDNEYCHNDSWPEVAAPLPEPTIKYGPIEAKFEQDGTKLTATGTFQAKVSPLPEIASEPICECDCVHCRAGNHRLCCKAAQCTPSPLPLGEPVPRMKLKERIEAAVAAIEEMKAKNKFVSDNDAAIVFYGKWKDAEALATKAVPIPDETKLEKLQEKYDSAMFEWLEDLNTANEALGSKYGRRGIWQNIRAEKAETELAQLKAVPIGEGELPPLESCPEELRHGYPHCECDLVGGDPDCTKKPTLKELDEIYLPHKQRERQLLKSQQRVKILEGAYKRAYERANKNMSHRIRLRKELLESEQRERGSQIELNRQIDRAELAEAELRSQERPEDAWKRAFLAGLVAASEDIEDEDEDQLQAQVLAIRDNILALQIPPYTPPQ